MKLSTYALILAAAASGYAYGAATAYTTPVGYVTINVPAESDTTISPPLEQATVYSAASTSIAGDVIGATGLTASAFTTPACYLQVTSGTLVGQRFPITANTTSAITVQVPSGTLESLGFVSTNTFKVVPFWTLNTLFPSGAGVGTTADALNPTSYVLASDSAGFGTNKSSVKAYIYCTGDVDNGLPAGWYDNDDVFAGPLADVSIDLSRMYTIRSGGVLPQSVVVSGQVPNVETVIPVAVNTEYNDVPLGAPLPIDVSLANSGLQSALQASTDALNPIELLFVYDDNGSGYNKSSAKAYFYCSGDVDNGLAAGWYDNDDVFAGPLDGAITQIKAGRCLVIRKAPYVSAGTVKWVAPIPYSL